MTYHVQFLLLVLAGWVNRQQQDVIDYLQEENRVLCQNAALLKKTTNQQLRRPWNPRRIQGISRRRADFRPMG